MGVNGIYGLSGSGLDIESMVKMGMISKQNQYEKMQQTYTKQEWTKQSYLDLYDKIYKFNNTTMTSFKNSNSMNARSAESSNSAIKVSASSSAQIGTHYITVNKVATNARLVGSEKLNTNGSIALKDVSYNNGTTTSSITSGDITFYIGDSTDSGVTPATYASASFSSTALSSASKAKSLLESALASKWELEDVSSVKVSGDTFTVMGSQISTTNTSAAVTTKAYTDTATSPALTFSVGDGTNTEDVNVTYADLAKLLNDDDATFQDFVDLLNQKMKEANVNVTASYDEADGFTFANKTASKTDKVSVSLNNTGIGANFMSALYDASTSDEQTKLFSTNADDSTKHYLNKIDDTDGGIAASFTDASMTAITIAASDIAAGATFNTLVSKINSAGTNVKASFDSVNGTFSFYNKNVGAMNSIGIVAGNPNAATLLNAMGLKQAEGNKDLTNEKAIIFTNGGGYAATGTNSSVLINGTKYEGTNSIPDSGITYNITNVTEKTSAVITVDQDVDTIVDNVKSFVENYNTLLGELYDLYNEKPNSSYAPLTDAQKAEMTEEQIKKWEEKAKAGLLYHDNNIRKIIDNMRSAVSDSVTTLKSTGYDSIYSIGISTNGLYGQLKVDEDKLRTALSNDADSVYNLFAKRDLTIKSAADNASDKANGIAQRLSGGIGSVFANAQDSITNIAGTSSDNSDDSTLSTLLRNLQTKMSNFKSMMNAFEDKLYKKYDAMEAALASLGSQMNFVTGAFS